MRYDRDTWRRGPRSRADLAGRGEYGEGYEGPYPRHGWSQGYLGGELRSRGSWDPRGEGTFEWGPGYIGGRGFGGGNYDLEHGYATGGQSFRARPPRGAPPREGPTEFSSPATRGGYAWGEAEVSEEYGPARYGYGPYYDRLRRRRRSDDELRQEVEDTLFYDTWVDADAIAVSVQDGVVTLRGTLPSYEELRYAVDDAWDVDGVRGVRSEMQVNEDEASSGRYEPGAPHMHGHPHAGDADASRSTGTSTSTSKGAGTSTSTSAEENRETGGGRRAAGALGATSAPPTGSGMAAGSARGSRASGGTARHAQSGAAGAEPRRGRRGRARGAGSTGGAAASGTASGESASGAGEGATDGSSL